MGDLNLKGKTTGLNFWVASRVNHKGNPDSKISPYGYY